MEDNERIKRAREAMDKARRTAAETHAKVDSKEAKRVSRPRLNKAGRGKKSTVPFHKSIVYLADHWNTQFSKTFPGSDSGPSAGIYNILKNLLNGYVQHRIEKGSRNPEAEACQNITTIIDFLMNNWSFIGKNWFKGRSSYPSPAMLSASSIYTEAQAYAEAVLAKAEERAYDVQNPGMYNYPSELLERIYKANDVLKKYEV